MQHLDSNTEFRITALVYGEKPEPIESFADDGESFDFERGIYSNIKLAGLTAKAVPVQKEN